MRRTVLVTGAAGFLGSHLVDRLLSEGFEVIGLDTVYRPSEARNVIALSRSLAARAFPGRF